MLTLRCAGYGLFPAEPGAVRYNLRCQDSVSEVKLRPQREACDGELLSASVAIGDLVQNFELKLSPGLVQVQQSDGSWKSLPFTSDRPDPQNVRFFHKGRSRAAEMVGGVAGSGEGSQSEGVVKAPMSGQVVKVPTSIGDNVEAGDIVLILEAMKMENEVTAPLSGSLVELSVGVGDTVSPGQVLFAIEAFE